MHPVLSKIFIWFKDKKPLYLYTYLLYGIEAIDKYGVIKGGFLTLWRIVRCNPFAKGGYDPVPEKKK